MAQSLCATLEDAEMKWRETSPEWKRKLEKVRIWQAGERERQRRAERLRGAKKASLEEEARASEDKSWESTFDPDQPSVEFSFVGSQVAFTLADLEKEIDTLRWTSIPEWAYRALRRGIAVHHSGMNKHYRDLVERYACTMRLLEHIFELYLPGFSAFASLQSSSLPVSRFCCYSYLK